MTDIPDGDIEDDPDALTVAYMAGEAKAKERLAAAEADAERLAEAATTVVCQTSAKHHPGYVVVRPEGFKALRAALAAHEARKGERHE